MLIDRPQITEGSTIVNATIAFGASDPSQPNIGELFFNTTTNSLRVYTNSSVWQSLTTLGTSGTLDLGSSPISTTGSITGSSFSGAGTGLTGTAAGLSIGGNAATSTSLAAARTFAITGAASGPSQTFDGSANVTFTLTDLNASNLSTGTVSASRLTGTYTIDVSGNASTATKLTTARTIGLSGVTAAFQSFDGTSNITIPISAVPASLLTGTIDPLRLNGTYGINVSGNAATATQLASSHTINGVAFNGTSDIIVVDATKLPLAGGTLSGTLTGTTITAATIAATSALTINGVAVATQTDLANAVQGLSWKSAVKAATTSNIALNGLQSIDGVALSANDRVLVKNQTVQAENGIYLVSASAWSRTIDADLPAGLESAAVFVKEGTVNADTAWTQVNTIATVGSSAVVWAEFASAAGLVAGQGIAVNGTAVSVAAGAGLGFSGSSLTINTSADFTLAPALTLASSGVVSGTYGNTSGTSYPRITVDTKGRITSISEVGISGAQGASTRLDAIAATTGTGLLAFTGSSSAAMRTITSGTHLSVTNPDGVAGNPLISVDATNINSASTIVARDASGNFSAGTITAGLTGAASLNVLKAGDTMTGNLTIDFGGGSSSSTPGIKVTNSANFGAWIVPKSTSGAFNPMVLNTDSALIFGAGAADTSAALVIAPWSASSIGLRLLNTGTLTTGSGFTINTGTAPAASNAWFSTPAYGVSQGDNRTHFGYNSAGTYLNYIRGAATNVEGTTYLNGATNVAGLFTANAGANVNGGNLVVAQGVRAAYGTPTSDATTFGYAFGNDGDTGLFANGSMPAATNVSVYLNANEVAHFDTTGLALKNGGITSSIRPDVTTYGTFKVNGSSNGYAGIQFGSTQGNVTLMANTSDNVCGVFNTTAGSWQWYYDPSQANIRIGGTNLVLHAGNYNSYSPTLTGGGASGNWAISITGSAASATSAVNSTRSTMTDSVAFWDGTARQTPTSVLSSSGSRGTDLAPNTFAQGIFAEFKNSSLYGFTGNYTGLVTIAPWLGTSSSTGDPSYQLAFNPAGANSTSNPSLKIRAGIDTTWGSWNTILHSSNYNDYAPTKTGGGASGTWGINISGSAATAGSATTATTSTYSTNWWSTSHNGTYYLVNNWDGTYWNLSSNHPSGVRVARADSAGSAGSATTADHLTGPAHTNGSDGWFRSDGATGWYNESYAVGIYATEAGNVRTYNGANFIAAGNISGANLSGTNTGDQTNISGNAGTVTHHDSRTDGTAYPIGWFSGANSPAYSCAAVTITSSSGQINCTSLYASQDVTAFSDRRLKTDIEPIADALYKVGQLEGVTFTRTMHGTRGTGLIAQDVQAVLPEAVKEGTDGYLGVDYGSTAGLLVQAIKELKAELDSVKAELAALKSGL